MNQKRPQVSYQVRAVSGVNNVSSSCHLHLISVYVFHERDTHVSAGNLK